MSWVCSNSGRKSKFLDIVCLGLQELHHVISCGCASKAGSLKRILAMLVYMVNVLVMTHHIRFCSHAATHHIRFCSHAATLNAENAHKTQQIQKQHKGIGTVFLSQSNLLGFNDND